MFVIKESWHQRILERYQKKKSKRFELPHINAARNGERWKFKAWIFRVVNYTRHCKQLIISFQVDLKKNDRKNETIYWSNYPWSIWLKFRRGPFIWNFHEHIKLIKHVHRKNVRPVQLVPICLLLCKLSFLQ